MQSYLFLDHSGPYLNKSPYSDGEHIQNIASDANCFLAHVEIDSTECRKKHHVAAPVWMLTC